MYFASDAPRSGCVERLVEDLRNRPDLNWMALVDTAFDYGAKPLRWSGSFTLVYESLPDLIDASPLLIDLPADDLAKSSREISKLLQHRGNRPMLSFIGTHLSMAELNERWRNCLIVQTPDNQTFVLRFADTRVLSTLPTCLGSALWGRLSDGVRRWRYIDRSGAIEDVDIVDRQPCNVSAQYLGDQEFAALLECAEADSIIDSIYTNSPEILPGSDRDSLYRKICIARELAKSTSVTSYRDIVALATLVVVTDGAALTDSALMTFLSESKWTKGSLVADLIEFA